jgi:hypothetical protein
MDRQYGKHPNFSPVEMLQMFQSKVPLPVKMCDSDLLHAIPSPNL